MANVIPFPQSPLLPFAGTWILDQFSVSRKLARKYFGENGCKVLSACGSMDEVRAALAADPQLAEQYKRRLKLGAESRLILSPHELLFTNFPSAGRNTTYRVLRVVKEGRSLIVTTDERYGMIVRMKKQWLLTSEKYYGREANLFPRAPNFRWYRAEEGGTV